MQFLKSWYKGGSVLLRRADPLLMGAAIAFNSLFAMVPLAIAFVSFLSLLERSDSIFDNIVDWLTATMPSEMAQFLVEVLDASSTTIAGDRIPVLVVSILIALWSGSRAVYAMQKALRLVQGVEDERGYFRARLTGIVVTIGAVVAVFAAYAAMAIGENAWDELSRFLGLPSAGVTQLLATTLALGWLFGLLYVIYRWGPPSPMTWPVLTSGIVTAVLSVGTVVAVRLLPLFDSHVVAVFGSLGLTLTLLYFVGVVVIAVPVAVASLKTALHELRGR